MALLIQYEQFHGLKNNVVNFLIFLIDLILIKYVVLLNKKKDEMD